MGDNTLTIKINGSAKKFLDEIDKVKKSTKDIEKVLSATAKASAVAFAGFSAAIVSITKSFADYETALVGVGKTTDIGGKRLDNFGKEFQKLSGTIPLTTNELLGIAQAAGQLGVKGEKNLLKFSKTIAQLGVSTDLSGEQAATSLTRILNVTKESIDTIDRFGAVLVDLGNNFAASESEIVRMANEVARATAVFGVSSTEAAALGTALRSVGVRAELGGSVVGKAFLKIQKAISGGGKTFQRLSELTGLVGNDLKDTFEKDSTKVFKLFLEGIGKVEGGVGAIFSTLEEFGLKGDEVNKVLPVLAKNSELVGRALDTASKAYKENTALTAEADKAYATLTSEYKKLQNEVIRLAVDIGAELAPTIRSIIIDIKDFVGRLNDNKDALAGNIATFLKWGAAITGGAAAIATFLLSAIKISGFIAALTAAFGPASLAASVFWATVTGPIGIAVAGIAAITAAVITLNKAAEEGDESKSLMLINKELKDINQEIDKIKSQKFNLSSSDILNLNRLNEQKKALEELKKAKEEAGELILRPDVVTQDPTGLGAGLFGLPEATIPLRADNQLGEKVEEVKKNQKEISEIIDQDTQKRIDKLKLSNAQLLALQKARGEATTAEELALTSRLAEIEGEFIAAKAIDSKTERELAIQNLQLKHEQELSEITAQNELLNLKQAEANQKRFETRKLLREEDQAIFDEWDQEDQERLTNKILSEDEIQMEADQRRFEIEIEKRNRYLKTEQEFGSKVAKYDAFLASTRVQQAKELSGALLAQARAAGEEASAIGKAAALTQIAINTPEAASSNYKFAAKLGGPIAGSIAAAIAYAFGAKQAEKVLGANRGGIVPSLSGSRSGVDSVPAMLTPNELVVPAQNFNEVVNATAESRGYINPDDTGTASSNEQTIRISIEPEGDFIGMIEQKLIETKIQNTGVA